jgi:5-methylthioadenosine/S-adenosylhomocysteine deaminase
MELAVTNGHVYHDGRVERASVGVRDGRIETVTDDENLTADRVVDADGGLVIPGLVNAHTHSPMTLFRGYADDLPFETWLHDRIMPAEAELSREDVRAGARLAALEMIRTGTTAFADMYFHMDAVAEAVEEAGLRAALGPGVLVDEDDDESAAAERIEEVAAFAAEYDGAAEGRIRTMLMPHAPYTCPDDVLREMSSRAAAVDRPYHIHVNETVEEVERLTAAYGTDPVLHLDDLGVLDDDAYIAHGVHLSEAEIETLADRGTGVAHCPAANAKLGAGMAPVDALVEAGVPVCLGTDGVASNNSLDMLEEMKLAALVAKARDRDATALDAGTVIEMATANGADALGIDGGRIAAGEPADMIVLDAGEAHLTPSRELLSHAVYAATGRDVTTTIVDGRVLMDDGEVETLDAKQVVADAERAVTNAAWP